MSRYTHDARGRDSVHIGDRGRTCSGAAVWTAALRPLPAALFAATERAPTQHTARSASTWSAFHRAEHAHFADPGFDHSDHAIDDRAVTGSCDDGRTG